MTSWRTYFSHADAFNEKIQQSGSRPLSNLTGGIHLHTIRATDEKTLERVIQGLKDKGFPGRIAKGRVSNP